MSLIDQIVTERRAVDRMVEHGIHTSRANVWLHFHPLEHWTYRYDVAAMLEYLSTRACRIRAAKSADKSITGAGYLVPKDAPFIRNHVTPLHYERILPWRSMTDREKGLRGERLVVPLIREIYDCDVARIADRNGQFSGKDFRLLAPPFWDIEVKTETFVSSNLFVQARERDHNPHLAREGDRIVERVTGWEFAS